MDIVYWILIFDTLCLLYIYHKEASYVNYLHRCINDQEATIKHLREDKSELMGLANEQNQSMHEMKAGMYEQAFVGFQNVKDEIERLANKNELNTSATNENV